MLFTAEALAQKEARQSQQKKKTPQIRKKTKTEEQTKRNMRHVIIFPEIFQE